MSPSDAQDVELLGRVGAREDEAAELVEAERLVDVDVVVLEARLHAVRAGEPCQIQRALTAPVELPVGQERHRAVVADHGLYRRARRVVGQARPLLARVLPRASSSMFDRSALVYCATNTFVLSFSVPLFDSALIVFGSSALPVAFEFRRLLLL
jgi:hypothetical protein